MQPEENATDLVQRLVPANNAAVTTARNDSPYAVSNSTSPRYVQK